MEMLKELSQYFGFLLNRRHKCEPDDKNYMKYKQNTIAKGEQFSFCRDFQN